eukprot:XP_011601169.1 PREDICTED: mucin-4-like [Takifugu rubripes]
MDGNGFDCHDVNECEQNSSLPHNCSAQALCHNTNGSYTCQCQDGYRGDGFVCEDVDECQLRTTCGVNMICSNTPGSYMCSCILGVVYDVGTCVREDVCLNASITCHSLARCHRQQDSFYCQCVGGYEGSGTECLDVDECSQPQVCLAFSYCFNTNGSYFCDCWEGFQDNGTHCQDLNECQTGNFSCPANSTCTNTEGSYECICDLGFSGNSSLCLDVDECDHGLSQCPDFSNCLNTVGSFGCECWDGYQANNSYCEDINECQINSTCSEHSMCTNTNGSYICVCDNGFSGVGELCLDVDECSVVEGLCTNGTCINTSVNENEQYLFPAPFANGFPGDRDVTLLAAFWDDVDLTHGDGRLLYQEYHKLDRSDVYSQAVFNRTTDEVTTFEMQKGRPAFTPSWILIITWDHVVPVFYHKINSSETNTFQCVLTTDGVRSFALLRYGEMGWGPGQRLYHDAIIGYTDGKSQHIEPTVPADNLYGPGGRYRPQQMKGNMGKFGQLVYNLTGSGGSNVDPGMRCQTWAMTEPLPTLWAEDLFTCPCTLSQALEDLSFMQDTTDPGPRVKTLRGQRWGGTGGHVFKSVLSNSHGSGKRCAYEPDGPLLAGYSERYFTEHNMQKHIAMVYGSLHFTTFDGTDYSFKALGEFVILRLSSSSGSNIFTLQGQTDKRHTEAKVPEMVRMAAFHQGIGKIEWRCATKADRLQVFVDGVEAPVKVGVVFMGVKDFAVRCTALDHCAAVYAGGLHVMVWRAAGHNQLAAMVEVPQTFYNRTVGLLGLWSSNRSDDFLMSDGRIVLSSDLNPPSEERLHNFGLSCGLSGISGREENPGKSQGTLEGGSSPRKSAAISITTGSTGTHLYYKHTEQCLHTLEARQRFKELALIHSNMPPIVTEPTVIHCKVNSTVNIQFMTQDPNGDRITYSLLYPRPPGASISSGGGLLTWTILTTEPVQLTIRASDQLASTLFTPILRVCNCLNGGTCQYGSITENHRQGRFQVVGCLCPEGFSGKFCGRAADVCRGQPCFRGVQCHSRSDPSQFTCGECPDNTVSEGKQGYKCFEHGGNVFNVSVGWKNNRADGLKQLMDILSLGFQNKFYNASKKNAVQSSSSAAEYRINMSSDTPHWYIRDYLARVSRHYDIGAVEVDDLDECKTKEAVCVKPALCANTYGGYRCVCNGTTDVDKTQSCVLDQSRVQKNDKQLELILGLVLGIGIPLLLLLLLAALACFCCCKKRVTGELPHLLPGYMQEQHNPPPFNYSDPALYYFPHSSPRVIDNVLPRQRAR